MASRFAIVVEFHRISWFTSSRFLLHFFSSVADSCLGADILLLHRSTRTDSSLSGQLLSKEVTLTFGGFIAWHSFQRVSRRLLEHGVVMIAKKAHWQFFPFVHFHAAKPFVLICILEHHFGSHLCNRSRRDPRVRQQLIHNICCHGVLTNSRVCHHLDCVFGYRPGCPLSLLHPTPGRRISTFPLCIVLHKQHPPSPKAAVLSANVSWPAHDPDTPPFLYSIAPKKSLTEKCSPWKNPNIQRLPKTKSIRVCCSQISQ